MYAIDINFGTGRITPCGLRDEFRGADIRTIDAPAYVPTGSHKFLEAYLNDRLYYVIGERFRDNPY